MNFFLEKQLIKFSCTYQPLSFCKIFKKFLEPIQNYKDVPFSGPKQPICPKQIFFGTNHYYYFHPTISPSHCAKFKKYSYSGSRVMRICHVWAKNAPFAPSKTFFGENYTQHRTWLTSWCLLYYLCNSEEIIVQQSIVLAKFGQ